MACDLPMKARRDGSGGVEFLPRSSTTWSFLLPCGACVGCRLERSRQWAVRCVHESKSHDRNSFVTLTYDDKHLPPNLSLEYVDFQRFMKYVRKDYAPTRVRFFMSGEYTEPSEDCPPEVFFRRYGHVSLGRPHFHAILFGVGFDDGKLFSTEGGVKTYQSARLDNLWRKGFATFGDVTFESAAYVARYCVKKVNGDLANSHYRRVVDGGELVQVEPEFSGCSLKPGIGADWIQQFFPEVSIKGKVVVRGREAGAPRFYMQRLQEFDGEGFARLKHEKFAVLLKSVSAGEMRDERLEVKTVVRDARVRNLKRKLN